jgi:hypothetical protein
MSTEDMLQPNAAWRLHAVLAYEAGLGAEAADDLLRRVALQAHMTHPWTALKNTFASMTLSVARVESTAYLLWGGLRPEVFDEHFAVVQGPWLGYPAFTAMVNELPPHASSAPMGNWVFSLMEWWSSASTLLRGAWVIPAMLLAGLVGLLRRDVVILVSAATAFGALFLAAVGDMPVERYWDPAVPFFVMAVGLSAAQLAEARRRRLGSTDSTRARDLDHAPPPDTRRELPEPPLVSVVMPCLNEADTVVACVQEAKSALTDAGLAGEVIVADNGSSDGSQELARSAGARVVHVSARGYGHALMAGIADARGQYVVMGDADQSYDFGETPAIVAKLSEGFDLVQGCRLPSGGGRVMPGAMPLLHRWWGNPMFSVLARWWFKAPIHDVYCGLRGFTKEAYGRLNLQCTGMEFAVEMIVRSSLMRLRVGEVPVTLRPDGRRTHAPHLRTFRDGWRTLRFFLLFSPRWLFLVPGLGLIALGASACLAGYAGLDIGGINLDVHTLLFGALMVIAGYQGVIFAILSKVFAIRARLLPRDVRLTQLGRFFSLERGLVAGTVLVVVGIALLAATIAIWARTDFGSLNYPRSMRVAIPGVLATVLGLQTILFVFFTGVLQLDRRHPGAD